jgi:hypothetical protein
MHVTDDDARINWLRSRMFFHEFFFPLSR